jgi:hypothetical protein
MNKEEIIKEIISILDTSNYVDPAEHIYDGLKQIKRKITYATVHDFLWALESSTVGDFDGKVAECANKIKPLLADMTIDEAYENYCTEYENGTHLIGTGLLWMAKETKDTFIYRSKTDTEFSEKWGLKIEERELSLEERYHIWFTNNYEYGMERYFDPNNIPKFDDPYYEPTPTKLITITYNDKTIESYE